MSELEKKNRYDYSKYDEMSTEALKEILRLDFQMSEETESDIDAILYISEVIAKREKDSPDVEAAWERFNTKYRPFVMDGRSLYDFGDEGNTPETTPNAPAAESGRRTFPAAPQRRRQRGPRHLVRTAIAAAILAAFLAVTSATAYAMGYDLWGTIAQWTRETFSFISSPVGENAAEAGTVERLSDKEYVSLQDALTAYGITESLMPSWIPEGFSADVITVDDSLSPALTFFTAKYSRDTQSIIISINMHQTADDTKYATWQKDDIGVISLELEGCTFYMMENNSQQSAVWVNGVFECGIIGDISQSELTDMIKSIYYEER